MPRDDYEERRDSRIERYEERSRKAKAKSAALWDESGRLAKCIPLGQPILVGHHSEKRDRAFRARIQRKADKSCEEHAKAKHYAGKAHGARDNRAISSDDPEAVQKIKAKIEAAEKTQQAMKAANRIVRKKGLPDAEKLSQLAALLHWTEAKASRLLEPDFCSRLGFPSYALQNNNANIRRMKARLLQLQAEADRADLDDEVSEQDGFDVIESHRLNRLQLVFPGKPSDAIRAILKRNGFRWCRSEGAWQRHLNQNSRGALHWVKEQMAAL